jgi:DinB superfamily
MSRRELTTEQIVTSLADAPGRIEAIVSGANSVQLRRSPAPGEWSANDVLAHLRACADVWGGCIARILAEDAPTLRAINPRTWIDQTDYTQQQFGRSFDAYATQRAELLTVLGPLTPVAWRRSATITGAGSPLIRTVMSYAHRMATHERPHLAQIERVVRRSSASEGWD